jgi:acetyl-CoA acetyltransferase
MSPNRVVVSAFAAVMIASGAAAVAVAVGSPSKSHTPAPYQDYLRDTGPGPGGDQCGKPVAQRTGAWFCPPDSSR